MKLHLHIGPGHHEEILMEQLRKKALDFSFSNYYPKYQFTKVEGDFSKKIHQSPTYEFVNYLTWGISNKFRTLRKQNKHYMFTYPLYDKITAGHIKSDVGLVFCWAQVSLHTITKAKRLGKVAVLDYPIPHIGTWKELLAEEAEINKVPSLHSQFSSGMVNRMMHEIELADYISVPSEFVKNTFIKNGVDPSKLIFNPYGIDTKQFNPKLDNRSKVESSKKVRVIFVGSIEYRKGVQYLLKAVSEMSPERIELNLVGTIHEDFNELYEQYKPYNHIKWLGQLNRPRVAEEMSKADVMVMPSILEGLSLTILECMACGTPVISTTNAGGLGLIEQDKDGWIIPIRSTSAIKTKLDFCIKNREKLVEIGNLARKKILSYYDHEHYGDRFISQVYNLIN